MNAKFVIAAAAAAILAAACGGGAQGKIEASCNKGGMGGGGSMTKEQCSCFAKKLVAGVDGETANAIADSGDNGDKMMNKLKPEQQAKAMGAVMAAGMSCALGQK